MTLPPIISTSAYSDFCGPRAFAAIVGVSRLEAAGALRRVTKRLGWPLNVSTYPGVLETALTEAGFGLEAFSGSGERIAVEPLSIAAITALVAPVNRYRGFEPRAEAPKRARQRTELSVREWLARFSIGTWALHVDAHVMAARDGELIAGDDGGRWNHTVLREAWRVLKV